MSTQRTIKFRAWNKRAERMWYSNFSLNYNGIPIIDEELYNWVDFILLQFTGLTDKNGKEIYEGDIVKFTHKKYGEGETSIWFRHGSFVLNRVGSYEPYSRDGEVGLGFYTPSLYEFQEKEVEVIGNIFENPELLEGNYIQNYPTKGYLCVLFIFLSFPSLSPLGFCSQI